MEILLRKTCYDSEDTGLVQYQDCLGQHYGILLQSLPSQVL